MINFLTLKILGIFDHFYQIRFINFLKKKNLEKFGVLIDVGAHKGESIALFSKNFEIDQIYSFEANPVTFDVLKKKLPKLQLRFDKTQISIENFALGSEKKKIKIKNMGESSSSTIRNLNQNSRYFKKKYFFLKKKNQSEFFKEIEIDQIKLSDFIKSKNIRQIDLMKIDTEGYELEVLKGSENILNITKYILFEHHYHDMIVKNYFYSDIHEFLLNNNFQKIYKSKMPFRKTFEYIYVNQYI